MGDEIEPEFGDTPEFAEGFGWQSREDVNDEIVGEEGAGIRLRRRRRRRRRHRRHWRLEIYGNRQSAVFIDSLLQLYTDDTQLNKSRT